MANPSAWRPVPNGRDLRKYARLFLRTDVDSDGFISHADAQAIFNKSALPPEVLGSIFNQANASQSSHMSFPEFVAAMHLIREARQTQQSPVISPEFMGFLSSFYESPNNLATQGSSKSAQAMRQMQSQAPPQAAWRQTQALLFGTSMMCRFSNDVVSGWNGTQLSMHDQLTPRLNALQPPSNSMQRKRSNAASMMQPLPRSNEKPSLG